MPAGEEHSGDDEEQLNGSGRKPRRGGGVRQKTSAVGLPAINHPSSNAVKGARLGVLDGYEVVREEEHGLFGLIARHIEVPKKTWDRHQEWCKEVADTGRPPFRSIFLLPIVPPYTPLAAIWSGFMTLVDFIYTAYWVPLGVAFCTESFGNLEKRCTSADLLGGCIYTLNMFLGFQFGCIITHDYKKMEVRDGLRVALYYIKYGRFWLDVLAVIPFIYLLIIIGTPSLENDDRRFWIGILSLIRLVRLLRLVSISKVVVMDAMSGKYHDITAKYLTVMQLYTLLLAYLLSVLINLEACIMLLIATLVGLDNSWLTSLDWEDFTEVSEPYRWYCAIYWVITTSTTTGYGDFTPATRPEQVFANIYMMLGMMMFGLMVGTIANALTRASAEAATLHRFRKKLSQVSKWLEDHKIPERTQKQVQTYFTEVWVNRDESSLDSEIFSDLPSYLRARVAQYVTTDLVLQMHVLRDQESGLQELVAQHLRPVDVTPGHDVCRQGEEGDRMWICAEGDLLALQHQAEPQYLNAPCMFGESIILADSLPAFRVRPWTVRTMGVVRLWELKLTDLWPIMRMYPQFQEDYLEYIRSMLLTELGFTGAANQEDTWCESVISISGALLKQSQAVADQAVLELRQARVEDGSLQELLDGLLEFSAIKSNRVTLLAPLQAQQASLQAEQQAFEQELQLQQYYQQLQQQQQQQQEQLQQQQQAQQQQQEQQPQEQQQEQQQQDEELQKDSEKPRASPGISPEQSAPESLVAGIADSVSAWPEQGAAQPGPSTSAQHPSGELQSPHFQHQQPPHQPQHQEQQQQHQQHQQHPYHRPPRRRRSWLHHGGFPPTLAKPQTRNPVPTHASRKQPTEPSDSRKQSCTLHPTPSQPTKRSFLRTVPTPLPVWEHPLTTPAPPPHTPHPTRYPSPPPAPPAASQCAPPADMAAHPTPPATAQQQQHRPPTHPASFPLHRATAPSPPTHPHPLPNLTQGPGWLTPPPVLQHMHFPMAGGQQQPGAPTGAPNSMLAFAHRQTGVPLASLQGLGSTYDASSIGVGGGSPGGTAVGSTLLPSLGVRGRATATGAGRADRAGPPAWLPESRSSMPRGIRTMSLANRPGQSRLGADSLPMENFGEGYGIWG